MYRDVVRSESKNIDNLWLKKKNNINKTNKNCVNYFI